MVHGDSNGVLISGDDGVWWRVEEGEEREEGGFNFLSFNNIVIINFNFQIRNGFIK